MSSFPEVSRRISHVFLHYYSEPFAGKVVQTFKAARAAARGLRLNDEFSWYVDLYKVEDFATSYFLDVIKYKEYHFNPRPGQGGDCPDILTKAYLDAVHARHADPDKDKALSLPKVAAFATKWWLRYMPISIHVDPHHKLSDKERSDITYINESFILFYCLDLMSLKRELITKSNWDNMIYHMKFRVLDDRSLMLAYSMLYEKR
ncbi:MAG: hypothetical protein HQL40_07335 [Alphaproteobacteria bacterium]|nr:hypothetical protein [Alphaproteobacteria bacterium]MBF0373866.1 hypothetical protein [Alphaproteobacteria bacterium]